MKHYQTFLLNGIPGSIKRLKNQDMPQYSRKILASCLPVAVEDHS